LHPEADPFTRIGLVAFGGSNLLCLRCPALGPRAFPRGLRVCYAFPMRFGRGGRIFGAVALAAGLALALAPRAHASIVERVVAVVGERPILLSDLRHRARPFLVRIARQRPSAVEQAAAETQMFRELLNKMIDDRLEEQAADKAHLSVSPEEIDNAVKNVAATNRMSVKDFLAEARREGLSEQDYRDEMRRQVLDFKLVQLRVRGRVRVTDEDARAAYTHWVKEMGEQALVEMRVLPIQILSGSDAQAVAAREALAADIVRRARNGEDFCQLVEQYADDPRVKPTCGATGMVALGSLLPVLQEAARSLKEGEFSEPLRYSAEGHQAFLIVQLMKQARVPRFEEVKDAMSERAVGEVMDRQRKQWLQELRRGVYVDVRL
jgi:peptidyl-prolyl cis-trans isomerase SurA